MGVEAGNLNLFVHSEQWQIQAGSITPLNGAELTLVLLECRHAGAVVHSSLNLLAFLLESPLEDPLGSWSKGGRDSASYFRATKRSIKFVLLFPVDLYLIQGAQF